jgi:FkbM family methyltransferase
MNSAALDRMHRWLARSRLVTRTALRLRNQCRAIIKYRLMVGHETHQSGEEWLMKELGASVRTFIDVGANRGEWTALLLQHAPRVERGVLIEPSLSAIELLRAAFSHDRRIEMIEAAASASPEESAPFFEIPGAGELSSLTRLATLEGATERRVRLVTLDHEIQRLGVRTVDLLKIDTEGHDLAVLRGATTLLSSDPAPVVQWEYGDMWRTRRSDALRSIGTV